VARANPVQRQSSRGRTGALVLVGLFFVSSIPVHALEIKVAEINLAGGSVRAVVELRDVFTSSLKKVIETGGSIYVRVEAELWEDRATWDRLVAQGVIVTFRVSTSDRPQVIAVKDPAGQSSSFPAYPSELPLTVDLAPSSRIEEARKYYMHAIARLGLGGEGEIEGIGDAVFGSDRDASGVASVGKFIFREVLRLSDYIQSSTAETTSRRFTGKQISSGNTHKP
jgi:hypothetical protein